MTGRDDINLDENEYLTDPERHCSQCGEIVVDDPDGSSSVLVHDRELGDRAYDLDEDHVPLPDH